MKYATLWSAALLLSAPLTSTLFASGPQSPESAGGADAALSAVINPCAPPDKLAASIEETVWRIWVAATCPVNKTQYPFVVWENWIEQAQMFPANPGDGLKVPNSLARTSASPHALHPSLLTMVKNPGLSTIVPGLLGAPNENCNKASNPPSGQKNLVLCEEVRENGSTEDYIAGTNLWNRGGQQDLAAAAADIIFPRASVEIKADWVDLSSIGFDCGKLPPGFRDSIHVETIDGNCFALAGMHLISKLLDNWVWATFEAQNLTTNPSRCKVLGCSDSFGSVPSQSKGSFTKLTPKLAKLMEAARLAPEWSNYRLDGVQTIFVGQGWKPTLLGNSVIEGENAGVPLKESSCISCHAVSSVKSDGTDGIKFLRNINPVGDPEPLPSSEWIRRDFVWSLSGACPQSAFQTCAQ